MSENPTTQIDWDAARQLAQDSIAMGRAILAAVNASTPVKTDGGKLAADRTWAIATCTVQYYGFSEKIVAGRKRTEDLAWARQVGMYFCRKLTAASFQQIGDIYGRVPTAVMAACKVVENRIQTEPRTAAEIEKLRVRLQELLS
jgi:chromosomal replication initiation ATPase DnaA